MSAIARVRSIVLDCPEPKELAEFYAALVGWRITLVEDDWVSVSEPGQMRICFQKVADYQPPVWPSSDRPQQLHLDFTVDDADVAEERALALGAVKHEVQPGEKDEGFRVYLDPVGHPFCLCVD